MAEVTPSTGTDRGSPPGEPALRGATCLTAVRDADPAEVIRLLGGDPGRARRVSPGGHLTEPRARGGAGGAESAEGAEGAEGALRVAVAHAGPAVVIVEYDGFPGSREEMLRSLSRAGGRAACARWGDDAPSGLLLAEDGMVLSAFETRSPGTRWGAYPEAWDPHLAGLSLEPDGDLAAAGAAAVARATGARLDAEWAAGPHLSVEIGEVPAALSAPAVDSSPLLEEEPFRGFLARPGPDALPAMEQYAVELAARHTGVADDALCTLALAVLDGCGPPEGRAQLRTDLAARAAEGTDGGTGGTGARRAVVWRALGDLLAREEGARPAGPPVVVRLARAMGDGRRTPEADRFRLLGALYETARRESREHRSAPVRDARLRRT
ncbi:hypothetical protein FM076_05395 [Streptomyces albus subsp. chlorinus]|uniref:DUF6461 domain-containing protein n=1 Tax=Streptomyces albus TaxID=1888 RepID=UPI00156F7630|nr:DUF6461 domain-containing protein [Streptomyces albus]NSC20669.1 hypothetical protein [Streptomyces albus subsp. chlorinus]